MSLYPSPKIVASEVWSQIPDKFRIRNTAPAWAVANKPGHEVDSFLEGPSFDRDGNLWVTDIPYGRIFRISMDGQWDLVCEYDGWPNGLKFHADGRAFITDYQHGIMVLDTRAGTVTPVLTHRHSESFRGVNDLVFDRNGVMYFTDQGQSGMHMANGRVYRYNLDTDQLDLLIDTGPSPNGLVLNKAESILYVAMTRGNSVWRLPLLPDGSVTKVGVFVQLSGGQSGPDGMALDAADNLFVAHAGNGCVWSFDALGHPQTRIISPAGLLTTNLAFGGRGGSDVFITESHSGSILRASTATAGQLMYGLG
ncbi:MAG: SMP-30/gluconolactonase/LRE family protein [Burkholderiaceae bacterium]